MKHDELEPYNIQQDPENLEIYYFRTKIGTEYKVEFIRYWQEDVVTFYSNLDLSVYELCFVQSEEKNGAYDPKISRTIAIILKEFVDNKKVVYFITDRLDGRSKELYRVYQLWYRGLRKYVDFNKIDKTVYYDNKVEAYVSILVLEGVATLETLNKTFTQILLEIFPNSVIDKL